MIGLTFQIATGPRLANCPKFNSMKTIGMPMRNNIKMNGMRKAPGNIFQDIIYRHIKMSNGHDNKND